MTINVSEILRKMMGWCPNAGITELNTKRIEYEILSANAGLPMLFSIATLSLIYNILIFKKLYSKLCYFNVTLLSGLFAAIILMLSLLNSNYRLEWSIYWAFVFSLLPSIPSFMSISLDKKYGGQKVVKEGIGLAEIIKRALGWCPNATMLNKK